MTPAKLAEIRARAVDQVKGSAANFAAHADADRDELLALVDQLLVDVLWAEALLSNEILLSYEVRIRETIHARALPLLETKK